MKFIRLNILIIFFAGLSLSSCDEPLFVSNTGEEVLVLNSILQVDKTIVIQLSKTRAILDATDYIDWIRNADVYLTCGSTNGEELLEYIGDGNYISQHNAQFGETYSVEIIHSKYNNVRASAVMPNKTEGTVVYKGNTGAEANFELDILDKVKDNFYIWEMVKKNGEDLSIVKIFSTDQKTDNILPDETQKRNKIFLQGSRTDDGFPDIVSSFSAENIVEGDLTSTQVRLLTVNKDMYKYFKSLELYRNSINNSLEPIEIYSNVENGLGIFGAYSETVIEITQ